MSKSPYVHSNFSRKQNDDYRTIDKRCVYGLLQPGLPIRGLCIDVCSWNGSGIIDTLIDCGYKAECWDDPFAEKLPFGTTWIVTNPPYKRPLVDQIIYRQIRRVGGEEIFGMAVLLRSNFDFAKSRRERMFGHPLYWGQVKLCFRPWWSEETKHSPIHNFAWHIWMPKPGAALPAVLYANGDSPC